MLEPKTFCCCSVRQATVTFAVVILTSCIIDIGLSVLGLPRTIFDVESHEGCRELDQMVMDQEMCQEIAARHHMTMSVVVSIRSLTNIVLIIVSSMLIHGVRRNRPCLFVPFLVVHFLGIVSLTLATVIQLVALTTEDDLSQFFVLLVFGPLVVWIFVYLFLVVRSCYLETKRLKLQSYTEFHDEGTISTAMN